MLIAHRGLWDCQNKIAGILEVSDYVDAVEVDVRRNSVGILVLCHDKDAVDEDNDTLTNLCMVSKRLHIILDIKGNFAWDVLEIIKGSRHTWKLASFDARCVQELCKFCGYEVGLISAGVPPEGALKGIDFVIQDYEFYEEDLYRGLPVYIYGSPDNIVRVNQIINVSRDQLNSGFKFVFD
jgi:hypothetical protein